jgi:hypothetical protein
VAGDPDVKRKRQLTMLCAAGGALIGLVLVGTLFPVHASFKGERSYNCGSPFHKYRSPNAIKSQWARDTLIIVNAYPVTAVTHKTPLVVCQDKVQFRLTVTKVVIVLSVLMIMGAIGLYWHLFGFIYDPHV